MKMFDKQGHGANAQPHLLIAKFDPYWTGGIRWEVQCPYEGPRACGAVQECNGTPEDVARWGCELYPEPPKGYTELVRGELSEERREEWRRFEEARERWEDEVHEGYRRHRTEECWFATYAVPNSDFEPEYYLAEIPAGTPINGPLKVLVGYEGHAEDTEPHFRLWEEPTDADS